MLGNLIDLPCFNVYNIRLLEELATGGSRFVPGVPKSVIGVPKLSLPPPFATQSCIHTCSSCRDSQTLAPFWHPLHLWKFHFISFHCIYYGLVHKWLLRPNHIWTYMGQSTSRSGTDNKYKIQYIQKYKSIIAYRAYVAKNNLLLVLTLTCHEMAGSASGVGNIKKYSLVCFQGLVSLH